MKSGRIAPALLATSLLIGGCDTGSETPSKHDINTVENHTNIHDAKFERRVEEVNNVIKEATQIVEDIHSDIANEVLEFIETKGVIVTPISTDTLPINGKAKHDKQSLHITFLNGTDLENPEFAEYRYFNSTGQYDPRTNTIIMKQVVPFSSQTKAILFLHEAFHAKDYYDHNYSYAYNDPATRARRELDAYKFQGEITRKIGQESYENYFNNVKTYLAPTVHKGSNDEIIKMIARIYQHPEFGPNGLSLPVSQQELYDQTNFTGMLATLELLEEAGADRSAEEQFMLDAYGYHPTAE
jgi:hypothetical protein